MNRGGTTPAGCSDAAPTVQGSESRGPCDERRTDKQNDKQNDKRANGDPDLSAVIDAWPSLPEAIRAGILAMVGASGGDGQQGNG